MKFDHLPQFTVTKEESQEYGDWVKKTAELLGRKYMQMHTIFSNEKWTLDEIRRNYLLATKHNGNVTAQVAWWAGRKRRLIPSQPSR